MMDYMLLGKIVAVCGLCGAGIGVCVQGFLMLVGLDSVQRWRPRLPRLVRTRRASSRRKRSKGLHRRQ